MTLRVMGPISALSMKYLAAGGRGKVRGEVACQVLVRFFALGCINHEQEKKREGGWAGSPGLTATTPAHVPGHAGEAKQRAPAHQEARSDWPCSTSRLRVSFCSTQRMGTTRGTGGGDSGG